jgi:hypothetical protein
MGFPMVVVIDGKGIYRRKFEGWGDGWRAVMQQYLDVLLKEPSV